MIYFFHTKQSSAVSIFASFNSGMIISTVGRKKEEYMQLSFHFLFIVLYSYTAVTCGLIW